MPDFLTLKGRVVVNLSAAEAKQMGLVGTTHVLEPGRYEVNDSGAPRTLSPALADHWYVKAHAAPQATMPGIVASSPAANSDPVAAEAARLRAASGQGVDGDGRATAQDLSNRVGDLKARAAMAQSVADDLDRQVAEAEELLAKAQEAEAASDEETVDDVDKPVADMTDEELRVHVGKVTGKMPSKRNTRDQNLALLPAA